MHLWPCWYIQNIRILLSDAIPGPSREWNIRIRIPFGDILLQKPFRLEFIRIGKYLWVTVDKERKQNCICSRWYQIASNDKIFSQSSRDDGDTLVQSKTFLETQFN